MLGVTKDEEQEPKQVVAPAYVQSTPAAISSPSSQPSQVRTGIIYSEINPTSSRSEVARISDAKPARKIWKTVAMIVAPIVATGAAIAILVGPLGMRVAHPQLGAGTSWGSASSSLIVTRPIDRLTIGTNIIADLPNSKLNPAIVIISAVSGGNVLVASGKGYFQVEPRNVRGSVFAVLPFIGSIFNLFG
jgi:energy-converting hydrogenase Eha subunit A